MSQIYSGLRNFFLHWKFLLLILFSFFILKDIPPILYKSLDAAKVINTEFYFLSSNPFSQTMSWDNFLTPFLAYIFRVNDDPNSFSKFLSLISFVSFLLMVVLAFKLTDLLCAYSLLFFLIGSPLLLILRNWIGFPDNITFLVSVSIVFIFHKKTYQYKDYFLLGFLLILGMLNHFFQFSMIVLLLTIIKLTRDELNRKNILFSILISYILSGVLFFILIKFYSVGYNLYRLKIAKLVIGDEFIRLNATDLGLSIFSLFHGLFPFVLYTLSRSKYIYSILILFCVIITSITYDTTRVFALLSMPIMLYCILDSWSLYKNLEKRIILGLSLLSPLLMYSYPLFYKWNGKIIFLNGKVLN